MVIGYGNPGRLDDGLGPAFAESLRELDLPGVTVESNYQLNIEDAELVSRFDEVIFVDASVSAAAPFEVNALKASAPMVGFSSHSVSAESVLGLAKELFGAEPSASALAIRGRSFDGFGERLSSEARSNLARSLDYFTRRFSAVD